MNSKLTKNQALILEEYFKVKTIHPSFTEISEKTGLARSYVFRVVDAFRRTRKDPRWGKFSTK